jgi:hypothetical protein
MATHRISKKTLSGLPGAVAVAVQEMAADYGIKSFTFQSKPEGYEHYTAEGYSYRFVYGEQAMGFAVVSQDTIGATGVRHEIGYTRALPAGTFEIAVGYYSGYHMTVTAVGHRAIAA